VTSYAIGIEDEVMLLDPITLALAHVATQVTGMVEDDPRFKLELPTSQLEIVTPPSATVRAAAAALLDARQTLAAAAKGDVSFAGAGVHPLSPGIGQLNHGSRYDPIIHEYGCVAERQLVCALQVHVALGSSDRALAVYNAARSFLPLLAALAANAPFYEGVDTGLASVRPKLAELLPRQGIPPAIESWDSFLGTLTWGSVSGAFPDPARWWWELRMHPGFGTLEFRVPDAQSTVSDVAAVAATTQALVAWLCARHEAGETLEIDPTWKIEQNRWSACRHGVEGEMADLRTGRRRPTRERLEDLFDTLQPIASALGGNAELDHARQLAQVNGAMKQRRIARDSGVSAVPRWLHARFLDTANG
jgi:carboxylate-amine ligase